MTLVRAALIVLIVWLTGCSARQACYAANDAQYWQTVEQCRQEGYGSECPYLDAAERRQEAADELCP